MKTTKAHLLLPCHGTFDGRTVAGVLLHGACGHRAPDTGAGFTINLFTLHFLGLLLFKKTEFRGGYKRFSSSAYSSRGLQKPNAFGEALKYLKTSKPGGSSSSKASRR